MIEAKEYLVSVTINTVITFSPIERKTPIIGQDAVDNAFGTMPDDFWTQLKDAGWDIAIAKAEVL